MTLGQQLVGHRAEPPQAALLLVHLLLQALVREHRGQRSEVRGQEGQEGKETHTQETHFLEAEGLIDCVLYCASLGT